MNALGGKNCVFRGAFGKYDRELLASDTGCRVHISQIRPQLIRYGLKNPIACRMTVGIVDLFEMIDVDNHQGAGSSCSKAPVNFAFENRVKKGGIYQSRKPVMD
jgi:hypothetical protein